MSGKKIAPSDRIRLSHTSLAVYQECPRKFELRYLERLIPEMWSEDPEALSVGRLFDRCINLWHDGKPLETVISWLRSSTPNRHSDDVTMDRYCRVLSMVRAYAARYPRGSEPFQVASLQAEVGGEILNPATGAPSKLLGYEGVLDGLLLWDGGLWIWELKTTSRIDEAYLERLWVAPQTGLYAIYTERVLGIPVAGILYDIVEKIDKQVHRKVGETESEYQTRVAAAIARNASGKTSAKRQLPETWDEYQARLDGIYSARPQMLHRETILLDDGRRREVQQQLWSKGQAILSARRTTAGFFRSEIACYSRFGDECEFLPICRSEDNPLVIQNMFKKKGEKKKQDSQNELVSIGPVNSVSSFDLQPF